jgi:mRNA-degrading endonuclease RelE of RelBE toxin-antitoxin system
MSDDPDGFTILGDQVSGGEFLRRNGELWERGLYLELDGYQTLVFLKFQSVSDPSGKYARLADRLGPHGVPSISQALEALEAVVPHASPLDQLLSEETWRRLWDARVTALDGKVPAELLENILALTRTVLQQAPVQSTTSDETCVSRLQRALIALLELPVLGERFPYRRSRRYTELLTELRKAYTQEAFDLLLGWIFLQALTPILPEFNADGRQQAQEWTSQVTAKLEHVFHSTTSSAEDARQAIAWIRRLRQHSGWHGELRGRSAAYRLLSQWLKDRQLTALLDVHRQGKGFIFSGERLQDWLCWMRLAMVVSISASQRPHREIVQQLVQANSVLARIAQVAVVCEYEATKMLRRLKPRTQKARPPRGV